MSQKERMRRAAKEISDTLEKYNLVYIPLDDDIDEVNVALACAEDFELDISVQ